jgi:hypothetical protein
MFSTARTAPPDRLPPNPPLRPQRPPVAMVQDRAIPLPPLNNPAIDLLHVPLADIPPSNQVEAAAAGGWHQMRFAVAVLSPLERIWMASFALLRRSSSCRNIVLRLRGRHSQQVTTAEKWSAHGPFCFGMGTSPNIISRSQVWPDFETSVTTGGTGWVSLSKPTRKFLTCRSAGPPFPPPGSAAGEPHSRPPAIDHAPGSRRMAAVRSAAIHGSRRHNRSSLQQPLRGHRRRAAVISGRSCFSAQPPAARPAGPLFLWRRPAGSSFLQLGQARAS